MKLKLKDCCQVLCLSVYDSLDTSDAICIVNFHRDISGIYIEDNLIYKVDQTYGQYTSFETGETQVFETGLVVRQIKMHFVSENIVYTEANGGCFLIDIKKASLVTDNQIKKLSMLGLIRHTPYGWIPKDAELLI